MKYHSETGKRNEINSVPAIAGQRSGNRAFGELGTVIAGQRSGNRAFGELGTANAGQRSGNRKSAITNRQSPIANRQSAIANGFTLIEIMLVVVIILIAAGVVVPKFKGTFKTTQMTDAVRSTVRLAYYARSLSILKQQPCILRFDEKQIVLLGGTNGVETIAFRKLPDDIKISSFENLADENRKPDGTRKVLFYPVGMNDGFKLIISTDSDHRAAIACNPVSGKITVVEEGR